MEHAAVDIRHLTHRYGDLTALNEVTFQIHPGNFFALLGPNGGGKTTLFRILSTLLRPTAGTARIFGQDTTAHPAAVRRMLGVVFQQTALDDELTVQENLQAHGALYGLDRGGLRRRIAMLLDRFGLADRARDRAGILSGGQRRRADLARCLLHAPRLLLLDEPTTGLDPAVRRTFWDALARFRQEDGTTILLATHLLKEAEQSDAVGIIDRGRLSALGTPEALTRALGDTTLWLDTARPEALAEGIRTCLDLDAQVVGTRVQVTHPEAPQLLPALYEHFGRDIDSATVRRPTLEDVFMVHTGHHL